jgi:hypothetical protein
LRELPDRVEGHRLVRERLAARVAPGRRAIAVAELDGPGVALLAGNTAETAYLTRRRDQLG